jgi:hypothetical protein
MQRNVSKHGRRLRSRLEARSSDREPVRRNLKRAPSHELPAAKPHTGCEVFKMGARPPDHETRAQGRMGGKRATIREVRIGEKG